jgi:succinoglycan biosynthesis transport protein ExoP
LLSPDNVYSAGKRDGARDPQADISASVDQIFAFVRRQWRVAAVCGLVSLVFGFVYIFSAVPLYTAATTVLIDRNKSEIVNQLSAVGSSVDDEASILSQLELLRSDTIAGYVVDRQKLAENDVFLAQDMSLPTRAMNIMRSLANPASWFADDEVLDAAERASRRQAAIAKVIAGTWVERVGRTYVIRIAFVSPEPQLSANIANAIADAYLVDKLNSKYEATRRASDWLFERIDELREQARASDLAVQKFRSDNGLVIAGDRLVSDQQLSELNTQLVGMRTDTARAKARLEQITMILESGAADATVDDVLQSSISNELRRKYLDASKLESDISRRLGPDHVQAVRLRAEMTEYQALMLEELRRIAESYRNELNVAEAREKSMQESVDAARGVSALAGEKQVELRELQRTADTYRNLYETFLQRHQEALQQQSFPVTDARIISQASVPTGASSPKKKQALIVFLLFGVITGGAIGAYRELQDRFFRTAEQVKNLLDVDYLGPVPLIEASDVAGGESEHKRHIRHLSTLTSFSSDNPRSSYSETLRATKFAVDLDSPSVSSRVVGIVSSLPGEGKSTFAINFAQLLAAQGPRVLLVDADLRNPGATRSIARHADMGLLEVINAGLDFKEVAMLDPKTKLAFMPTVSWRRLPHSSELLGSQGMQKFISSARSTFDYVIVDLPPLAPVIDAKVMVPNIDSFVYVVEWGKTSRTVVRSNMDANPDVMQKCVGAVLSKVDQKKMRLYSEYGSSDYYAARYRSYYQEGV